jgi:hypothetical protein
MENDVKRSLLFAAVSLMFTQAYAQTEGNGMQWRCRDTSKNSMQCEFRNSGKADADLCVDVVKVCARGDHTAPVCTDRMRPGDVDARVVNNFTPKVGLLESCQGIEYRRKVINQYD